MNNEIYNKIFNKYPSAENFFTSMPFDDTIYFETSYISENILEYGKEYRLLVKYDITVNNFIIIGNKVGSAEIE